MSLAKPSQPAKSPPWILMHLRLVLVWIALLGGFVGLFWMVPVPRIAPNPEEHRSVGRPLSYVDLMPLTGHPTPISKEELLGRVTLINFWGTWCRPCRDELPHLADLQRRYAGREAFQLLAVSCPAQGMSDDVQSLRGQTIALLDRLKLDLPTYYDPRMATRADVEYWTGETAYPLTILLDRQAKIRAVWVGYWPGVETAMERCIGAVLDEKNPSE